MTVHANRCPFTDQVRQYNRPKCSERAAKVDDRENCECGRRDKVFCVSWQLNSNWNEVLHTFSVIHRSSISACFVLHFVYGCDGCYPELKINESTGTSGARRSKISPSIFNSWYFFQHKKNLSCIWRSCKLMIQLLVHHFWKAKAEQRC